MVTTSASPLGLAVNTKRWSRVPCVISYTLSRVILWFKPFDKGLPFAILIDHVVDTGIIFLKNSCMNDVFIDKNFTVNPDHLHFFFGKNNNITCPSSHISIRLFSAKFHKASARLRYNFWFLTTTFLASTSSKIYFRFFVPFFAIGFDQMFKVIYCIINQMGQMIFISNISF